MALLHVPFNFRVPQKPKRRPLLSSPNPTNLNGHVVKARTGGNFEGLLNFGDSVGKASLIALLSLPLLFANPALAFKGGGPYGQGSILRQANFKGAKLIGASFFDADLTGADLSDSDLRSADFSLANVTKANLSNANLEGALVTGNTSFKGTNIAGAVIKGRQGSTIDNKCKSNLGSFWDFLVMINIINTLQGTGSDPPPIPPRPNNNPPPPPPPPANDALLQVNPSPSLLNELTTAIQALTAQMSAMPTPPHPPWDENPETQTGDQPGRPTPP
ncbi:hypothetical protein V2J09_013290 [Rumex salicifolius]